MFSFSVQQFDLASHLNTAPELVDRVYNRPTLQTLETKVIQGAVEPRAVQVKNKCNEKKIIFILLFLIPQINK